MNGEYCLCPELSKDGEGAGNSVVKRYKVAGKMMKNIHKPATG